MKCLIISFSEYCKIAITTVEMERNREEREEEGRRVCGGAATTSMRSAE
jgi:hypothetical protein